MRVTVTSRTIGAVKAFAAAGGAIGSRGGPSSEGALLLVASHMRGKCRNNADIAQASQLVTDRGAFPLFGRCPAGNLETRHRVNIREEEDADVCQLWMRNPRRQAW